MIRLIVAAILALGGCSHGAHVERVIDGDTIEMSNGDIVRIAGIDTPEKGECGFDEATDRMVELVEGQEVRLELAGADEVDRYGRLIRYVLVENDDAGLRLIDEGLAIARYDSRDGYGRHDREELYVEIDRRVPDLCGTIGDQGE